MKLNKKGFTLVELLAVVVILLAISVIAVSSISAAIERNKAKQNEAKKEIIISYAKLYYDSHKNSESDKCINFSQLDLGDSESKDADGNDDEEKFQLASAMLAYINASSIGMSDGMDYVEDCLNAEECRNIFEMIFDAMDQKQHYDMMYRNQ